MKRQGVSSNKNDSEVKRQRCKQRSDNDDCSGGDKDGEDGPHKTFKQMLSNAGLKLRSKHAPVLSVDQAVFQRDLTSALKDVDGTHRQVIKDFVTGFAEHIEDAHKLWWCLNPTKTHPDCDSARSSHQDTVVRLLLGIQDIQLQLMTTLLDKLMELSLNDESFFEDGDLKNVPKMILFQFRWLDTIADSSALCEKLLEIASVVSTEIHNEIIACIPEILEDKDHETVAIAWSELLKQKTEFTPAILDSLPNLIVSADILVEVRTAVLKSLDVIEVELFPIVVKFLLQSLTPTDSIEVLSELRLMLDFSAGDMSTTSNESYKVLTLGVIKTAVKFHRFIGNSLVKVLEDSNTDKKPNLNDLFLVLVLASVPIRKKAAENILVMKIKNTTITEHHIRKAFNKMKPVCQEYFSAMLSLSSFLLSITDDVVREFGGAVLFITFTEIDDPSILQEVVSSLVSHIRGGNELEIGMALNVVKQIVAAEPKKMMPFSVFLKGLLDRLDSLSLSNVRKVYEILANLGQSSEASGGRGVLDDLYIIVRKQLTNSQQRYRRMGVVGALTTLQRPPDSNSDSCSESDLASMKSLLNMVEHNVSKDFESKALFFEELSAAVSENKLDKQFQDWLGEHVTNEFQDEFVIDANDKTLPNISDMSVQLAFGLDDVSQNLIAVNLIKVAQEDETFLENSCLAKRLRLPYLSPQFRLISHCELATNDGNLERVDALLGCSLYMFSLEMVDRLESISPHQRRVVCRCLFAAINWFIELINVFVIQTDDEIVKKVVQRIRQMVELREQLEKCLKGTQGFTPPLARFNNEYNDKDCTTVKVKRTVSQKATKDKPMKTSKRKRSNTSPSTSDPDNSLSGVPMEITKKEKQQKSSSEKPVDLNQFAVFFRELDMEVFLILKCKLELKSSSKNDSTAKLGPRELCFLLADLRSKLQAVLGKPVSKAVFFKAKFAESEYMHQHLKSRSKIKVVKFSVKLLQFLKLHFEAIGAHLNDKSVESDDDDEDAEQMMGYSLLSESFCVILDVFAIVFGWKGFNDRENNVLLSNLLQYFNKAKSAVSQSSQTVASSAGCSTCFEYFRNYSSVTSSFDCAVSLVKLLNVIASISCNKRLNRQLVEVCEEVLKRDWNLTSETSKTTKFGSQLASVLKIYFNACDDVLESLERLTTEAIPEMIKSIGKSGCSKTFPTLTKNTLPIYYESIHTHLISFLRNFDSDRDKTNTMKLRSWLIGVRIFHVLSQIIKEFDSHRVVSLCLKYGRAFVELFVKTAMPLVDRLFRTDKEDVQSLLKSLQQSTRFLQSVCSHSKVAKNVALTNAVPPLRKSLEVFVLRVKEMLAVNNCKDAFWLGNLKNRNLQGEEILSQVMNERGGDESESAEGENDDVNDATKVISDAENSDNESNSGNISQSY